MLPNELTVASFASYPPDARALVTRDLTILRALPLSFLPLLLREAITYDWKFPVEREELDRQFAYLRSQTAPQLTALMRPFASLTISPDLVAFDWVNDPTQFSEKLSAYLWASHQIDSFRKASVDYVHTFNTAMPPNHPDTPRVSVAVIGQQAKNTGYRLFRKLRPHGVYYQNVDSQAGLTAITNFLGDRVEKHPASFGHWFLDGGAIPDQVAHKAATVSYEALQPSRLILVQKMMETMKPGGGGPELLRTQLAQMRPSDLSLPDAGSNAVLSRFKVNLLTQGSGTQIFSTTFIQWTAREVLRRAQPLTLVARFSPRQRDAAFSSLRAELRAEDPDGSLVDADMAAYYTWLNQARLPGANDARFVVWFEGQNQALIISPSLTPNTSDSSRVTVKDLLTKVMS